MPLLLHTFDPEGWIPKQTLEGIASFCARAQEVADVRHRVPVRLVASEHIWFDGDRVAIFWYGRQSSEIYVAGLAHRSHLTLIVDNLAHELAHYCQWRDGDSFCEYDADERAAKILAAVNKARRSR